MMWASGGGVLWKLGCVFRQFGRMLEASKGKVWPSCAIWEPFLGPPEASSTWAQYDFQNSLLDTSGNGRDFTSGSNWIPEYGAGVVGQAVYLNAASGVHADNSNSWLKGPVINSAEVSGQYFEISFNLALVSSGCATGEEWCSSNFLLSFTSTSDATDSVPLFLRRDLLATTRQS